MSEQAPPTGTLTFLLIKLDNFEASLDAFDEALSRLAGAQAGYVFSSLAITPGENRLFPAGYWGSAFEEASAALTTMLQVFSLLPSSRASLVLYTGPAQYMHGSYLGSAISRVTRLLEAAQPGQRLVSQTTQPLLQETLPAFFQLHDLGERVLRGMVRPEPVYELREIKSGQDATAANSPTSLLENYFSNLIMPLAPLVGRENLLESLLALLSKPATRIVTLLGSAGVGKTRLALEAGQHLQTFFEGEIYFVPLALLGDFKLVAGAIAQVFDLQKDSSPALAQKLAERLGEKRCLLILDNFEQVRESVELLDDLLSKVSKLTVLVTSRVGLNYLPALELVVPPLALPDLSDPTPQSLAQNAAVQLFSARAAFSWPDFELYAENAETVGRLCHLLEGKPLALELAASRVLKLKPATILNILRGRFNQPVLTDLDNLAPESAPDPVETVLEWNYEGLSSLEKRLFERLAVFRNGATLAMLTAVYSASADPGTLSKVLDSLKEKKFLHLSLPNRADSTEVNLRYTIFETMRSFALERLRQGGEYDLIQQRYARYYLQLLEQAEPALMGAGQQQALWLARLEAEHINLRVCLADLLDENVHTRASNWEYSDQALQLCGSLWRFWMMHSYLSEGRHWLERVLQQVIPSSANLSGRAKVLLGLGTLCWLQSDYAMAGKPLEQSLALFEQLNDQKSKGYVLNNLGLVLRDQRNYTRAQICFEQSLALRRYLGERRGEAFTLGNLGLVMLYQGVSAEAQVYAEQSLAIFRELDDHWGIAVALNDLAEVLIFVGQEEAARLALEEALDYNREVNDKNVQCEILQRLGHLNATQTNYGKATAFLKESLQLGQEIGYKAGVAVSLNTLALVVLGQGVPKLAVRLSAAAATLRQNLNNPLNSTEQVEFGQTLIEAQRQLDEAEFYQAWTWGLEGSLDELLDEIMS